MAQQFMRAAGLGVAADGLLRTMPPQGQELLSKVAGAVARSCRRRPSGNGSPEYRRGSTIGSRGHAAGRIEHLEA